MAENTGGVRPFVFGGEAGCCGTEDPSVMAAASPLLEPLALPGCNSQSPLSKPKAVELAGPFRTVQRPPVSHSVLPKVTGKAPALRLPAMLQSPGGVLETPLSST